MKKATILCACLLLSSAALATPSGNSRSDDGFDAFWQKFRTAVISGDKEAVIGLSRFPIRMPGKVRNIKDGVDLGVRYREVFNKYTSAAKCFGEKYMDSEKYGEPVRDSDNPKLAAFSCGDNTGYWIVYDLELTKTGWKFIRLERYLMRD